MNCRTVERLANIDVKFTKVVSWRSIIAHCKVWWSVRSDIGKTFGTVLSSASDPGSTLPNNLRKVTPIVEIGHIRVGLAVEVGVVANLTVVEEFCDDRCYVIRSQTSSDILSVATTVGGCVVGIDTSRCDLGGSRSKSIVPDEIAGGMIGTVDVVRNEHSLLICCGLCCSCR